MPAAPVARISRVASSAQRCETVAEGNPVERRAVTGLASADALKIVDHPAGAIFRNEYVIDQNVIAAGRTQAGHTPSMSDPIFGLRDHEQPDVGRSAGSTALHSTAEQGPLGIVATAGEAPMAAELKSAVDF